MKLTNLFCCTAHPANYSDDTAPPLPPPPRTNGDASSASLDSTNVKSKKVHNTASKSSDVEPYSAARANQLFASYADEDDADVIGPEGFEQLCNEADIPLDGAMPLILAWLVKGSEMAKITRSEWDSGMAELQCVSETFSCLSADPHFMDLE